MNRSPILRALSSMKTSGAKTLLMGGQACVFYGAAEFSRDLDLLIFTDPANLALVGRALESMQAEQVAVPPFAVEYLDRGHAVHFRCRAEGVAGLRIDLMSNLRGVGSFEDVWSRLTVIEVDALPVDLLSIEDLVHAKKTQRDKDWPMIRRLIERGILRSCRKARRCRGRIPIARAADSRTSGGPGRTASDESASTRSRAPSDPGGPTARPRGHRGRARV